MQTRNEEDAAAAVTRVIAADQTNEKETIVLKAVETKSTIRKDHPETFKTAVVLVEDVDQDHNKHK